jgi:antitoxin MazE
MQVSKWGNSLAVRLPAKLVAELGLKEGDEIEVRRASDGVIEVAVSPDRKAEIETAFAKVRALKWTLPADYTFDRNELYDRDGNCDAE